MSDSGEGLVDAEARLQEQIDAREEERRRRGAVPVKESGEEDARSNRCAWPGQSCFSSSRRRNTPCVVRRSRRPSRSSIGASRSPDRDAGDGRSTPARPGSPTIRMSMPDPSPHALPPPAVPEADWTPINPFPFDGTENSFVSGGPAARGFALPISSERPTTDSWERPGSARRRRPTRTRSRRQHGGRSRRSAPPRRLGRRLSGRRRKPRGGLPHPVPSAPTPRSRPRSTVDGRKVTRAVACCVRGVSSWPRAERCASSSTRSISRVKSNTRKTGVRARISPCGDGGWLVHVYTASGAVIALLALDRRLDGRLRDAFLGSRSGRGGRERRLAGAHGHVARYAMLVLTVAVSTTSWTT